MAKQRAASRRRTMVVKALACERRAGKPIPIAGPNTAVIFVRRGRAPRAPRRFFSRPVRFVILPAARGTTHDSAQDTRCRTRFQFRASLRPRAVTHITKTHTHTLFHKRPSKPDGCCARRNLGGDSRIPPWISALTHPDKYGESRGGRDTAMGLGLQVMGST